MTTRYVSMNLGTTTLLSSFASISSNNQLQGALPETLAQLTRLRRLHLEKNQFQGTVRPIKALGVPPHGTSQTTREHTPPAPALTTAGPLPPIFTALVELEVLTAGNNQLTGPIPDFSACKNLREVELHDNYLDGPVPPELSLCQALTRLTLSRNCLTVTGASHTGHRSRRQPPA
jgi:Leucine-rich repeat (LRR) protein